MNSFNSSEHNKSGDKVLFKLLLAGDVEGVISLVTQGLDVKQVTDNDKWNLLHCTLVVGPPPPIPMLSYLIESGVEINGRDRHQWTPLHFAARNKQIEVVKLLLDAGAEVDPENDKGLTPLRLALKSKPYCREVIELLISYGADPGHVLGGRTVRQYVEIIAHGEDADLLSLFN